MSLYRICYFLDLQTHTKNKIDVELNLAYYATDSDLKNATGVDTSKFSKNIDLASLKSDADKLEQVPNGLNSLKTKVDKLSVDQLVSVSVDLKTFSDVVDKEAVKKDMHDELVKKISAIQTTDTSNVIKKADYDIEIEEIDKKITTHDYGKYNTNMLTI